MNELKWERVEGKRQRGRDVTMALISQEMSHNIIWLTSALCE